MPKVVNLGLPKSGTTTLAVALQAAGLRVADGKIMRGPAQRNGFVGKLMYDGYFRKGDPLALLGQFDAFTEISALRKGLNLWPQTDWGLISAIRQHHPGTRFLLTRRDPARVSDSMARWSNLGTQRLPEADIPGLPVPWGGTHAERIRWIEGHYAFCERVFAGADDFCAFDVADPEAPNRIGVFLGLHLPWWGVANANPKRPEEATA